MPTDLEVREKRRNAILEIVMGPRPVRSQGELLERLSEIGVTATQPSISRDLRDLGVVRVNGRYTLKKWVTEEDEWDLQRVSALIEKLKPAGPYNTVVITRAGAARFVALTIDAALLPEVVGTVAGEDTVLVLTDSEDDQHAFFDRFRNLMAS
jgi:transcriptional regulator of arginine metabolism